MKTLSTRIRYQETTTRIVIGNDLISKITTRLEDQKSRGVYFIVDRNVLRLHADAALRLLLSDGVVYSFPSGEKNKNMNSAAKLLAWLHDNHADRTSTLVAIGGGVVTDIAGFVASTYMRGISYLSVPTTLVGQVDAAIGGKTAVNLGGTKNLAGTFYPPEAIYCDSGFLNSLRSNHLRDGLVEAIKIFATRDRTAFDRHSAALTDYLAGAPMDRLIADAVRLKVEVVNRDPFEKNLRRVLNFGHTAGHAIEAVTGVSHGRSVAFGILVALNLSAKLARLDARDFHSVREATTALYAKFPLHRISPNLLWERIQHDKKKSGSTINFVLLKRCGEHAIKSINYQQFKRALDRTCGELNK